jgi:hypothetical protein
MVFRHKNAGMTIWLGPPNSPPLKLLLLLPTGESSHELNADDVLLLNVLSAFLFLFASGALRFSLV